MDPAKLSALLERVQSGQLAIDDALAELRTLPFTDLGFARVDHHRALRQGVPEVVFAQGKTPEHIVGVVRELISGGHDVLVTRLAPEPAALVVAAVPALEYVPAARIAKLRVKEERRLGSGFTAVVTAGTSDIPVAEEAAETLGMCGVRVERIYDVGVAGLHRLLAKVEELRRADAVIAVAGMEGAMPSVLGGLVAAPVVAVPTSIGYGVSLSGMTALFGMLSSCAAGITVVNIDNGFGAAMAVVRLLGSARVGAGGAR
ncbi:MAG TPA: nickel pincer cofactor biosynthesis protein LarB [Polyangiaceae bacterium]|nr:nickel pincer cofactor biosynthesis protein LarB [Polyangiaceae bacterium]